MKTKCHTYLSLDGLPANGSSPDAREVGLRNSRMNGAEAFKTLLELRRETVVRLDLGKEKGISSSIGLRDKA